MEKGAQRDQSILNSRSPEAITTGLGEHPPPSHAAGKS